MPIPPSIPQQSAWTLTDAKARLSSVVQRALSGKPQRIVRGGHEAVIVVSEEAYNAATRPKESLIEFFARSPHRDVELDIERARDTGREIDL